MYMIHMCIYIYIVCIYIYMCVCVSIYLSIYLLIYSSIYLFIYERGGSPVRAIYIENTAFLEVTFCDCVLPSVQCLCIVGIIVLLS